MYVTTAAEPRSKVPFARPENDFKERFDLKVGRAVRNGKESSIKNLSGVAEETTSRSVWEKNEVSNAVIELCNDWRINDQAFSISVVCKVRDVAERQSGLDQYALTTTERIIKQDWVLGINSVSGVSIPGYAMRSVQIVFWSLVPTIAPIGQHIESLITTSIKQQCSVKKFITVSSMTPRSMTALENP